MKGGLLFLLLSALCSALGNSLQPVSVLAWFQPAFLLLGFQRLVTKDRTILWILGSSALTVLLQNAATTFAFAGLLKDPNFTVKGVLLVFSICLLIWTGLVVICVWGSIIISNKFPSRPIVTLAFPILWSGFWSLLAITPIGTTTSPGYALLDYLPLTQVVSVLGLPGILFLQGWMSSILARHLSHRQAFTFTSLNVVVIAVFVTIALYGGVRPITRTFYQKNLSSWPAVRLQVSCITGQAVAMNSTTMKEMWLRTAARLLAGDQIVLWSEAAVDVDSQEEEDELLRLGRFAMSKGNSSYLGLAYGRGYGDYANKFVLLGPGGTIAWNYTKSHLVPFVDEGVRGKALLPTHQASFGKLGGAICYDMDFPDFIRQAGRQGVDLFLQPSWTWGPIGTLHFRSNAVRAVENGFTFFRCSSNGISGLVDPYYQVIHQYWTTGSDFLTFSFPLTTHVMSVYPHMGYVFEWLCVGLGGIIWGLALWWPYGHRLEEGEDAPLLGLGREGGANVEGSREQSAA